MGVGKLAMHSVLEATTHFTISAVKQIAKVCTIIIILRMIGQGLK